MDNNTLRNSRLMTAKEMATYLNVCTLTVRKMAEDGRIGKWQPGAKNCTVRYYLKGDTNV